MEKQPDIIFIVLDTQRADRLGCYGNAQAITPHLDRFAKNGILFEQAVSPAQWTIPAHASFFTGLYPTEHQITQSNQKLNPSMPHLAELLTDAGYETIGFCNNPLVGVLNNGFRRGFEKFFVYGGAAPTPYSEGSRMPWPLNKMAETAWEGFRMIADPVQDFFGRSPRAFRLFLGQFFTPIWSRFAHFKGQNERSVRHLNQFLRQREETPSQRPLFLFLNLMETHFPFWPPDRYLDQISPSLRQNPQARAIHHRWNREAYRWAAPLAEPLPPFEAKVLSDLYDAEVAYQDDYLGRLFEMLESRKNRDNTLTVIVGDHGDGLGEHNFVGHAFVAYQELIHVPLMLQWPKKLPSAECYSDPISTRRLFHTFLDAAQVESQPLSLFNALSGNDVEQGTAYAEVYPPLNFVTALELRSPELIEKYRCLALRRAVLQNQHKLIQVGEQPNELFSLSDDPFEEINLIDQSEYQETAHQLNRALNHFGLQQKLVEGAVQTDETFEVEDKRLLQQLRGLGYLE